jgi:hypothetical protein
VTRAAIENVTVDGKPSTIAWDGGRPLPISGNGALEVGSSQLTADPTGLAWALDGAARSLTPGQYRANFTVAVGSAGIANVRENPAFTATADSVIEVTHGTAFIRLAASEIHVQATQPTTAVLDGTFTVTTADGESQARHIAFGPGLYDLTLTPATGGFTVEGILQGPTA